MGSLVLMLPSLARKPPQDRTMLEKMAAGMLEESLQKHVTDLEKQLEDTKEAAVSRRKPCRGRCRSSPVKSKRRASPGRQPKRPDRKRMNAKPKKLSRRPRERKRKPRG